MGRIIRHWQRKSNPYEVLMKIRKKKRKTKYEKLVLEHRDLVFKISNELIAQSKQEITDNDCIENIRKALQNDRLGWLFEKGCGK